MSHESCDMHCLKRGLILVPLDLPSVSHNQVLDVSAMWQEPSAPAYTHEIVVESVEWSGVF